MSLVKKAILGIVGDRLLTHGQVADVQNVSANFRVIVLESRGIGDACQPGDKVQVNTGEWELRTYTPLRMDADRVKLLAFARREATPGARWVRTCRTGDRVQFRGPSRSLELAAFTSPTVLFGDETSFGLAASLRASAMRFAFEVSVPHDEARAVLAAFNIAAPTLVTSRANDEHIAEVRTALVNAAREISAQNLLLTGRAHAIQALRRERITVPREKTKPYWALGKSGID